MKNQVELENPEAAIEQESEPISPMTVVLAVILVSIPLGLCCYYLLRL